MALPPRPCTGIDFSTSLTLFCYNAISRRHSAWYSFMDTGTEITVAAAAMTGDPARRKPCRSNVTICAITPKSYCTNPVLDAVLVNAAAQTEQMDIRMEIEVALPEELPVDVLELSIVFANALENAIQAVKELPDDQRCIICKSVTHPRFMMEISNPYAGKITFDRRGVPVTDKPGHGIGTRSIVAFAEKNNALCLFRAENGWFKLQIAV